MDFEIEKGRPFRVSGFTPASAALILLKFLSKAHSIQSSPLRVILICPNDDSASELLGDLETLKSVLMPNEMENLQTLHFPTWERSPYSPIAPALKIRLARLKTLASTMDSQRPLLVTTSLAGFAQATISPDLFRAYSIQIKTGEATESREALLLRMTEAGYLRVDTTEDPGSFSARGEIIDVFPVDRDSPVRVELFGDEVETIRPFDPGTQRTHAKSASIQTLTIPPAREVMINSGTQKNLREKIKAHADHLGVSRASRDPILASVQMGAYHDHSDTWAPFAYDRPSTLLDYVSNQTILAWYDETSCKLEWQTFLKVESEGTQEASKTGLIVPPISDLYCWSSALQARTNELTRLFLDRLESPDAPVDLKVLATPNPSEGKSASLEALATRLRPRINEGFQVWVLASTQSQLERVRFLLEERKLTRVQYAIGSLSAGFTWQSEGLIILTESEILGTPHKRGTSSNSGGSSAKSWSGLQVLSDLAMDDAVVHADHGIGRYRGLVRLSLSGAPSDFLLLEYADKDKLYLPVYRMNVVQKYVGGTDSIGLDKLGSQQFEKTKEKVRNAVKTLAFDLVQLYAQRKLSSGFQFSPRDSDFQEFEAKFPFDETPDQLKAINDTLNDLESGRVMDRIVCGDVGYGKTEVAIRAAFRAVSDGKQVAVLVPTTLLTQQHEQSFRSRLGDYSIRIDSLSRFKTKKEQEEIIESVKNGRTDIVIGTHRLLSKDIAFKDLGLLVIDEEHRFGVEHKEKLKTLKINTHVLTLTATPIPRTLHMALSGLREISLINTPPVNRLPIRTYVSAYDEGIIKAAIETELSRGGQVFFLHNRVQNIAEIAKKIQDLVPSARVVVGHGQMAERELEKTVLSFYENQTNVLVCTTIIESGLDIPRANTILVNRADQLGLAQLYQIRGRVGRGQQRAFAYLLLPEGREISEDAKRRLEVLQKFVELGSGFSIASHDLEIRGGGDLLGPQQSGSIAAVGFDLYTELLEEAIRDLQGKPPVAHESKEPDIKVPFPAFLSEDYVPDVHQRLSLYRRFSGASEDREIDLLEEEVIDRFGSLPEPAQNLVWLLRIKIILRKFGIESLTVGKEKISLLPGPRSPLDPTHIISLVAAYPGDFQLTPDSKVVVKTSTASIRDLFFGLESLMQRFVKAK